MNPFSPRYSFRVASLVAVLVVAAVPAQSVAAASGRKALTSLSAGWAKVHNGLSQNEVLSL